MIQEEQHGVLNACPEETPESIENGLQQLQMELDSTPPEDKRAYLQAIKEQKEKQQRPSSYVTEPDFQLRFLRTDLWDIKKAVKRMVLFCEMLLEFFGPHALQRPIGIDDFTDLEIKACKKNGECQLLPFRDRSGRRIFAQVRKFGYEMDHRLRVS
jgi:hypothetical protein